MEKLSAFSYQLSAWMKMQEAKRQEVEKNIRGTRKKNELINLQTV